MSETHCAPFVPVNTLAGASVKFQFPESMSFDPMSIHAHAAPQVASRGASADGSLVASLSVRTRRRIWFADMSETAARGTVVDLTLPDLRGRMSFSLLEILSAIAFDGCGVPS
jgi:hypothetical protein